MPTPTPRIRPTAGWVMPSRLERGPNGKALCRECGQEVPPGRRRTFCSQVCVDTWRTQTDPGYCRTLVWRRDTGVCAICAFDTKIITPQMRKEWGISRHRTPWEMDHAVVDLALSDNGGRTVMGTRRPFLVPEQFGTLQGVRILSSGRCRYTLCR